MCHDTTCYLKNADCSANLNNTKITLNKTNGEYSLLFDTSAGQQSDFCVKCSNVDQTLEAMNLKVTIDSAPPAKSSSTVIIIVIVVIVLILAAVAFFYFKNKKNADVAEDLSSMKQGKYNQLDDEN